jgi:hypothetical protein
MTAPWSKSRTNRTGRGMPRARRAALWMVGLAPLVTALASISGGCTILKGSGSSLSSSASASASGGGSQPVGTGGAGGAGGMVEAGPMLSNEDLFNQTVLPGLEAHCVPCHVNGGFADFLAPPDPYQSITVYKSGTNHDPLIWPVPSQSILYTYPDSSSHPGTKYTPLYDSLKAAVLVWLTQEAASLPPPPEAGPSTYIVPFSPILESGALNVIYLDTLGPSFVGSSISFVPTQLGNPPSLLQLSNLQVYPAGVALEIVHPRFDVYPAGSSVAQPDPSDTLSDVNETFIPQGTLRQLGAGEVLLDNWQMGARLGLDFSQGMIEALNLTSDGGIVTPCNAPVAFQTAVTTLGMGGPLYCATNCHGGPVPTAMAAMNLSGLLASPPDYATACSYMLTRIVPGSPSTSQILDVTNPANVQVVHLYKFMGNTADYQAFTTGISPWIIAE